MTGYLLDTSTCIAILRGSQLVADRLKDPDSLDVFAQERLRLWKSGKKIDDFDLFIGCAAKAKGLTIVTHNVKHFEHIEGLDIVDWVPSNR